MTGAIRPAFSFVTDPHHLNLEEPVALVIEDNRIEAKNLCHKLNQADSSFHVYAVSNEEDALAFFEEHQEKIKIIFSDCNFYPTRECSKVIHGQGNRTVSKIRDLCGERLSKPFIASYSNLPVNELSDPYYGQGMKQRMYDKILGKKLDKAALCLQALPNWNPNRGEEI